MAKVIVIDDDHSLTGLLKEYLKELGHSVATYYNAVSALRKLKSEKFDVLISDVNMYPINGYDLICEVREFNKTIKIVAMSGSFPDTQSFIDHAVSDLKMGGADKFMMKPFTMEDLQDCLTEVGFS